MDVAANLVASMLAKRDQWLRKAGSAPSRKDLELALQAERARILARARALHPKASPDFASAALTQQCTWRQRGNPVPVSQQTEPLRPALEALLPMPDARYTTHPWQL